jgi:hypothetical protein
MGYLYHVLMTTENLPPPGFARLARSAQTGLESQPSVKPQSITLQLEHIESLEYLTSNSRFHFERKITDFAIQVTAEAKAIEQREHAGKGPPEITAAHIDEAWWVVRRRIRHARYPILTLSARVLEAVGAAGIGVGATAFHEKWGAITFIVSCLTVMCAFLAEAYTANRD